MEIRFKLYPYPVLAPFLPDVYKTSRFDVDVEVVKEGYNTKLQFSAQITNPELSQLIREGKACFVYHLECAQTGFRKVIKTQKVIEAYVLSNKEVRGRLQICPFIAALQDLKDYTSSDFSDDYAGMKFDIEAGSVLAVVGQQITADISDNLEDLADTPSIFSIIQNHDETIKHMQVDFSQDKIVISLPYNDYFSFSSLNQNDVWRPVLNSMTVVPALVYVLDVVKKADEQQLDEFSQNNGWYRTIRKVLREKFNCDIEAGELDGRDSMELAQMLINDPMTGALAVLSSGISTGEGGTE